MTLLDKALLPEGNGFGSVRGALTDGDLARTLADYKRHVVARYQLVKSEDISGLYDTSLYTATKLDGQLFFLVKDGSDCFLVNARGRVLVGLPLLVEAEQALSKQEGLVLAGELYCPDETGRSRVYRVTSALGGSAPNLLKELRFGVFDVVRDRGQPFRADSYATLIKWLQTQLPKTGAFHAISWQTLDLKAVSNCFRERVLEGGEEGLVCYSVKGKRIYKIKPRHNVDVVIIGFTEAPDEAGTIRVLLTALMRPDGTFQSFARVGTGFDTRQRHELYALLAPLKRPSNYMETDRNHTLFTMIEPKYVAEIAFHDILVEGATGKPQIKAVLSYDSNQGWQPEQPERFVNLLFSVFVRLRDDKEVNPVDLRLTQIRDLVALDNLESHGRRVTYQTSEMIRREVYTKVTKGATSVRKLLFWQTHKHEEDPDYPAFVFCYCDYSPNRAQRLKRTLRAAATHQQGEAFFEAFRKTAFKKGWELVP